MKKILVLILLFTFNYGCFNKKQYYHGYVLDDKKRPIENVKVMEDNIYPFSTVTDSSGYFRLYKRPDLLSNLIFLKKGYLTDTIKTVRSVSGEKMESVFLNNKADTIQLESVISSKSLLRN